MMEETEMPAHAAKSMLTETAVEPFMPLAITLAKALLEVAVPSAPCNAAVTMSIPL